MERVAQQQQVAPTPLTAEDHERLIGERRRAQSLARHAEAHRVGTTLAFYKSKVGFGPTILSADPKPPPADSEAATPPRHFRSWQEAMARRRLPAQGDRAPQQLSLATHGGFTGDMMFVHAGEVQEHVSGPGPHNDDDGTDGGGEGGAEREETLVVRMSTELWWPIQLSRPLERSRMHGRCHVHIFWLDRDVATEELRWRLLGERECVVYYDNLLIDPSHGQPFVIRADAMRSGWDEDANITSELAPELCERLDAAAEAHGCAVSLVVA